MKHLILSLVLCVATISFVTGCTTYPSSGSMDIKNKDMHVTIGFSDEDRRIIRDYYKNTFPPGLAKKEKLPPGLQKHLNKQGALPPGLEKRRLPSELERRLSALPGGYMRLKIGNDIAVINEVTQVIVDIIYDAGY